MELSMSSISLFLQCQKAFEYRVVRGLRPEKEGTDKMNIGTLFHAGCHAGYKLGKQIGWKNAKTYWPNYAHAAVDKVLEEGYDYHGERREIILEEESVQLVHDMLDFYWENSGQHDEFDEIAATEEPFTLSIADYQIRNTFDLVVRESGRLVVYDHKTVANVKESAEFLPLDFQIGSYLLAAARHFGEPVEFVYNMVRRAAPRELTKSGRKSTSSKDPADYLRRERLWKSETELDEWAREIEEVAHEIEMKKNGVYLRSPSKSHTGCLSCIYKSICSAELVGHRVPVELMFKVAA